MAQESSSAALTRRPWYHPHSVYRSLILRPRVLTAIAVGIAAAFLLPADFPPAVREALAWCMAGTVYLIMAFRVMSKGEADRIRTRAARQDDSAVAILVLILLAMFSSFAAIFGLISVAKAATGTGKLLYLALAAATIVISWTVTQAVFTLHYAHEYYAPDQTSDADARQGLLFPKTENPDYWDFFYFATSLGAASQTSDVSISSRSLRRLVTFHAVVSFFFNTMVLALTINLAAGLA